MSDAPTPDTLPEDEIERTLIESFRNLDPEYRATLLDTAQAFADASFLEEYDELPPSSKAIVRGIVHELLLVAQARAEVDES